MKTEVVILAAGQGTRMRSKLPKVLHCVAGKPMLGHVIDTANRIDADVIHVVVGHGSEAVIEQFAGTEVNWVTQQQQLGTGHAVAQALPAIDPASMVLVTYGDVPLVKAETLAELLAIANQTTLGLLTINMDDPAGYGRIVRSNGDIQAIVEQKDASKEQREITEVNTGILAVPAAKLAMWLPVLSADNAQGEYYLTDIIAMAVKDGMQVKARHPQSVLEVEGANNRNQVAKLERYYQQQQAQRLMTEGASLADPARIDIRGNLTIGQDISIDINCIFIGEVSIADDVIIGANCVIENSQIGPGCEIKANCVLENVQLQSNCEIGPFARLRPGTVLADKAKIGNFVETKKSYIGVGSKVNHLSYVGDSNIGEKVNIGAGTITCNYDGINKFTTTIGDGAFIGSNTSLVAPVNIGKKATIAAGSTITSSVEDQQLAVARGKQRNIDNWLGPVKKSDQ